jgi:hypothetical protein
MTGIELVERFLDSGGMVSFVGEVNGEEGRS